MLKAEYENQHEFNRIKSNLTLTPEIRRSLMQSVKKTFHTHENSSMKTIFSISNTMVGSSVVVFPLIFNQSGIFTSVIVLGIIGIISYTTCLFQVIHFRPDELDLPDAILRILGKKWYYCFIISSILLVYIAGMIYFLLCANMFYPFLKFLVDGKNGNRFADKNSIDFTKFSFQYTGIILICVHFIFFCLKDLKYILKMAQFGISAIVIYIVYIIILGIINLNDINFRIENVKLFSTDFATLSGVFALSFFIHSVVIPIIKNNREYENNKRDLGLGYLLTAIIYLFVGIFGAFAINGKKIEGTAGTVLDYFSGNIFNAIVELLLFFQLCTVLPILWYCTRSQIFTLIYKDSMPPSYAFYGSNIIFALSCLLIQILNIDPSLIISLDGAVCGFMLVYILPIRLHVRCLYGKKKDFKKSMFEYINYHEICLNEEIDDENKSYVENLQYKLLENEKNYDDEETEKKDKNYSLNQACASEHIKIKKFPKSLRLAYLTLLFIIGFAIMIIKLLDLFHL